MSSVDLQLPRNWTRWNDEELRQAIKTLEDQVRAYGWQATDTRDYLRRLDSARLVVLRNELDRRIERRSV